MKKDHRSISLLRPVKKYLWPLYCELPVFDTWMFNSVPNDKILDLSKLKPFADNKIKETQKLKFAFGRVEKVVGKGEKCWLPDALNPLFTELGTYLYLLWNNVSM